VPSSVSVQKTRYWQDLCPNRLCWTASTVPNDIPAPGATCPHPRLALLEIRAPSQRDRRTPFLTSHCDVDPKRAVMLSLTELVSTHINCPNRQYSSQTTCPHLSRAQCGRFELLVLEIGALAGSRDPKLHVLTWNAIFVPRSAISINILDPTNLSGLSFSFSHTHTHTHTHNPTHARHLLLPAPRTPTHVHTLLSCYAPAPNTEPFTCALTHNTHTHHSHTHPHTHQNPPLLLL
jgi:hypothetical protein